MFLTILLVSLAVLSAGSLLLLIGQIRHNTKLSKKNSEYWAQIRNQDQDIRNTENEREVVRAEVKRVTNKLIEVQNKANLTEEDAKARIEEFKKLPMIACMTDNQVHILAEMLAIHVRQILEIKKEWVN